jgi:4-amino-4-deoxy-L-arabinose transferase-like glycosyltransferase
MPLLTAIQLRRVRPLEGVLASPRAAILALILVTLAVRLLFAASTGLGIDETYTVATARTVVLSTYDHPPMAWWLTWAAIHVFGSESPLVVRLPFVLLFTFSTWQMYRLGSLLFGEAAGLLAALALNCAPVLGVTSATWVLPDGPLIAAMLSAALAIARVLFSPRPHPLNWLVAGFFGGLALLSKYHGVFIFAGTGLFLVTNARHRHWLATAWPYAGAALALLIFFPVIVWNAQHLWASFAFQGQRGLAYDLQPWKVFIVLAGQSLFLLPWIWAGLMFSAGNAVRRGPADDRRWLLFCLGIGPVFAFTIVALWSRGAVLFHWAAPGYLMWFPMLAADLEQGLISAQLLRSATKGSAVCVVVLVGAVSLIGLSPWPFAGTPVHLHYPLSDMADWRDLRAALQSLGLLDDPKIVVAGVNWHEVGKIAYALDGALPVTCICADPREFGVLDPDGRFIGRNVVVVTPERRAASTEHLLFDHFVRLTRKGDVVIRHLGTPVVHLALLYGVDFRGPQAAATAQRR